jgi:hypothetical protein
MTTTILRSCLDGLTIRICTEQRLQPYLAPTTPCATTASYSCRTFLSWLHFAVVLGGLAVGLLNFGDKVGKISAAMYTIIGQSRRASHPPFILLRHMASKLTTVPFRFWSCLGTAMGVMIYALVIYQSRARAIRKRTGAPYDDRLGPVSVDLWHGRVNEESLIAAMAVGMGLQTIRLCCVSVCSVSRGLTIGCDAGGRNADWYCTTRLILHTAAITTNFILKFGEFNSKARPRAANAKDGRNASEKLTSDYPSFPNHSLLGLDARLGRIPHPLFANLTAGEQQGRIPITSILLRLTRSYTFPVFFPLIPVSPSMIPCLINHPNVASNDGLDRSRASPSTRA